jgi:FkbM family methyltransferase
MNLLATLVESVPSSWIRTAGALRGRSRSLKKLTDWLPQLLRHREGRIRHGVGRGLRFNTAHSAVGFLLGTHDPEVQFAFEQLLRPGMTVYDVGANVGFTAVLAAQLVGPDGLVVCFEPLPVNARQIEHNATLNHFAHVRVWQVALGNEDGEAEFVVSSSPTWGRLATAGFTPQKIGTTLVSVRRLDGLATEASLPPPDLIKMDVEGGEVDVLAGAAHLLDSARPVLVIETHGTNQAVADALAGHDYRTHVLGSAVALLDAPREVQALCLPAERTDLARMAEVLTRRRRSA